MRKINLRYIKSVFKKYRLLFFFFIITFIFIASLVSTQLYYLELEKKGNFVLYKDIPYIDDTENINYNIRFNLLDVYVPDKESDQKFPVMIFVHGGGWAEPFGNKDSRNRHILKGIYYTDRDFILVNINYRLYPEFNYPSFPEDVSNAILWVYENIEEYNGDKDLIFLKGHSAGAQISSLVATNEKFLNNNNLDLDVIKGVILLEGVGYDIFKARDFDIDSRLVSRYLLFPFGENDDILRKASSINHVEEGKGIPPMILFTAENTVLRIAKIEAFDFYLKLIDNNIYARYFITPQKNHSTLSRDFGYEDDFTTIKSEEFLRKVLRDNGYFW